MSTNSAEFRLSGAHALAGIESALKSEFNLEEESETRFDHVYYDSFDWRLYASGACLRREIEKDRQRLIMSGPDDDGPKESVSFTGDMPRFCWDFPESALKENLSGILDIRALLPLVELRGVSRNFKMLDDEQKTVLRIRLEQGDTYDAQGRMGAAVDGIVRLLPVRGYDKYLGQVKRFLTGEMELVAGTGSLFDELLASVGKVPCDYSSKLDFWFTPEMQSEAVARHIQLHLLDTVESNIPGTRDDLDSEFLHDLRVAVRRARSALTQIKGVFPEDVVERFKPRLAWLGQITGPTRDMHVYLLAFDEYRDSLPEVYRRDLEPLHRFLLVHQRTEHEKMVKQMESEEFRQILAEWRSYLETPDPEASALPSAGRPISETAGKRICKIYGRVLEEGLAITDESPSEALHELRKNCKKLRYLIEFYRSIYAEKDVKPAIRALKILLDNLGLFQDLEVQAHKLREFAHQMSEEGDVPADTLLAMGMLVDGLLKRQHQARTRFSKRFAEFADKDNQDHFKHMFSQKKVKQAA
jgi:CHAD domain-containing protein